MEPESAPDSSALAAPAFAPLVPRVLALCIHDLSLQRVQRDRRRAEDSRPLAVVHEGRVAACDPAARARGVRPGDSEVQAEATCDGIQLLPLDPVADAAALAAVAEAMQALSPTVELAPPDVLLLDAAAAHLFRRDPGDDAEALLLGRATSLIVEMGYRCRPALASGKAPARALARHGQGGGRPVPPGATAAALAPLPLAALPELPAELVEQLTGLGISDLGGVARLPPETLAHRFGLFSGVMLRLARGEDSSPLVPYAPQRLPEEGFDFESPVDNAEPLYFALKRVADRAAARLAGRGLGATRLDLVLRLDPRGEARIAVPLARPSAAASRWLLVLRERIAALRLDAPVAGLLLVVAEASTSPGEQLDIGGRSEEIQALETVLARLAARLGDGAAFSAEPVERHRPEAAYRSAPFLGGRRSGERAGSGQPALAQPEDPSRKRRPRTADWAAPASPPRSALERPTRLLAEPIPLVALGEGGRIAAVRFLGGLHRVLSFSPPERLHGEWWREPFDRDYHRALLDGLGACWIYRDRADGRLWLHGFFD